LTGHGCPDSEAGSDAGSDAAEGDKETEGLRDEATDTSDSTEFIPEGPARLASFCGRISDGKRKRTQTSLGFAVRGSEFEERKRKRTRRAP
jgi:hypothetical protein